MEYGGRTVQGEYHPHGENDYYTYGKRRMLLRLALFLVTCIPQISLSLPYWAHLISGMGWVG